MFACDEQTKGQIYSANYTSSDLDLRLYIYGAHHKKDDLYIIYI